MPINRARRVHWCMESPFRVQVMARSRPVDGQETSRPEPRDKALQSERERTGRGAGDHRES
jgi:hypothetical protein